MSEANILNPTAASLYSPDWPIGRPATDGFSRVQAKSGEEYFREALVAGRTLDLTWTNRSLAVARYLERWHRQYERGFFSFYDVERARYYSGRLAGLRTQELGNERRTVTAQFVELPGKPLYAYPTNWNEDAIFVEERGDDGKDQVKLKTPGNWVHSGNQAYNHLGGGAYYTNVADETAEFEYVGYGFRVWAIKDANHGKTELSLDGVVLSTIDLYAAVLQNSNVVDAAPNVPFGRHRVKLRVTNTKNAASTGYYFYCDAIEVMK